jgi:hypothetical protein
LVSEISVFQEALMYIAGKMFHRFGGTLCLHLPELTLKSILKVQVSKASMKTTS